LSCRVESSSEMSERKPGRWSSPTGDPCSSGFSS
jgi:hypothetical protein